MISDLQFSPIIGRKQSLTPTSIFFFAIMNPLLSGMGIYLKKVKTVIKFILDIAFINMSKGTTNTSIKCLTEQDPSHPQPSTPISFSSGHYQHFMTPYFNLTEQI